VSTMSRDTCPLCGELTHLRRLQIETPLTSSIVLSRIALVAVCLLLAGCSVTYVPPKPPPPTLPPLPSVAPSGFAFPGEAAGNVDCTKAVGSQTGYTLFGAKAEDFNAAHQGSGLLIRCSNDGKVIV